MIAIRSPRPAHLALAGTIVCKFVFDKELAANGDGGRELCVACQRCGRM